MQVGVAADRHHGPVVRQDGEEAVGEQLGAKVVGGHHSLQTLRSLLSSSNTRAKSSCRVVDDHVNLAKAWLGCHVCQRWHLVVGAPEVLDELGDPLHAGEVEPDEGDLLAPSGPNDRLPRSLVIKRLSLTCMLVSFSNPLSEAENLSVEYIGSLVDACNDGAIFPHAFRS